MRRSDLACPRLQGAGIFVGGQKPLQHGKISKSLNECSIIYLEDDFGLRKTLRHDSLNAWLALAETIPVSDFIKRMLTEFQELLGQALAAMPIGQVINENRHPIYGCHVRGRDWCFMTLSDKQYCISRGFDTTTDDVYTIFRILRALKEIVIELTA